MNVFSTLYRVFYDKKLAVEFIKNGKGHGGKMLLVLALFTALAIAVRGYFEVGALKNLPVSEITENMPEIVFENNKIVSPENYYASFSDEEKTVSFAFDTTDEPFMPSSVNGLFVRKDALISQNNGEIRIIPYRNSLNGKKLKITRESVRALFPKIVDGMQTAVPFVFVAVLTPAYFLWYIVLSYFYGGMSYLMTYALRRKLEYDERLRLSVLSLMPWAVLNALATFMNINIRFGTASGLLLTLIYMFCFLKEEKGVPTV